MATTERPLPAEGRRTNSLGWAEADCHTCATGRKQCDRRRPFCMTCTSSGTRCQGYATKLDWQSGIASRGHMKQKKLQVPARSSRPPKSTSSIPSEPIMFTFIDENDPKKARKRGRKPAPRTLSQNGLTYCTIQQHRQTKTIERLEIPIENGRANSDVIQRDPLVLGWKTLPPYPLSNEVCQVLSFYEQKFSYCTLTYYNVPANPWRTCLPMAFDSPCLMDGILALGKRFRARLQCEPESFEVTRFKDRALQGFNAIFGQANVRVLVATILVLVGLEYAESGHSHWLVYLSGAHNVIATKGGIQIARLDAALRCQIAMLAWYDVTTALMARRRPLFPRSYMESITRWRSGEEWSLMTLNGCPDELFVDIYDVAVAAAPTSRPSTEDQLILERRLWVARPRAAGGDHSSLLECWRFGLLLFCARVFKTPSHNPFLGVDRMSMKSNEAVPGQSVSFAWPSPERTSAKNRCKSYAEEILHIVRNLPPYSNVQKQCLMPLLFAGCELASGPGEVEMRLMVTDYLQRWDRICGIGPFRTALSVMRTVWGLQDKGLIGEDVWWGDVVRGMTNMVPDQGDQDGSSGNPGKEYLFG